MDASSGKILEANPFMAELSGYSMAEFIGKELWEIGLFRDKAATQSAFEELQQKGYVRYDHLPLKSKTNPPVEVELVSNIYQWDHRHIAQFNIRDISDRTLLERQTKQQASELSDLHRRKDEFLAMLSHELRSPLAPIANAVQVLVNLLSNAAKYTDEGGQVWLTVELDTAGTLGVLSPGSHGTRIAPANEVIIRVRDSGVGISPDLLPHVFDLFTQAERSLDRSQGGLGIGLALVLRLTELHGGKVEAFSELEHGSEFVVRLPVAPTETPQTTLSVSETRQPITQPLRVLVVDDNADTLLSFRMLLQALGHEVETAHDGPTAVQAAIDYRPDVMLLDIGLPGLNGYEVAKKIRLQPDLKNVVLVALTGYGQEADRQTSLQAGFNQHLVKPARFDEVHQILASVSRQRK